MIGLPSAPNLELPTASGPPAQAGMTVAQSKANIITMEWERRHFIAFSLQPIAGPGP